MYGQLGDIIFDGLYGPETHVRKDSVSLPQHKRINRRPKSQFTGVDSGELKLKIRLNRAFINVEVAIEKFRDYRNSATHLKYITGSGTVIGTWLIKKTKEKWLQTTPEGDIVDAILEIDLIEAVSSRPEINALASSENNPTISNAPNWVLPATMGVSAALDVSAVRSLATVADETLALADPTVLSQIQNTFAKVKDKVATAQQHMADAAAKVQQFEDTVEQAIDYVDNMYTVAQNAATMIDYIDAFDSGDPVGSLHAVNLANTEFMSSVGVMTNTSQPLSSWTGSRR